MDFKKWVKNIQTAGYNGPRTVFELGFVPKMQLKYFNIYEVASTVCKKNWI